MSRFSHRQPAWTFGVVLLSTLLLSPVTASVVLRALMQSATTGDPVGLRAPITPAERANLPHPRQTAEIERSPEEPRRLEDETGEVPVHDGERFQPRPDTETDTLTAVAGQQTVAEIALLLPQRIVLTVPDDTRLGALPAQDDFPVLSVGLPPTPPRAPPFPV